MPPSAITYRIARTALQWNGPSCGLGCKWGTDRRRAPDFSIGSEMSDRRNSKREDAESTTSDDKASTERSSPIGSDLQAGRTTDRFPVEVSIPDRQANWAGY